MDWTRRGLLGVATTLGASLAGCSALDVVMDGGPSGTVPGTADWQQPRGTAGATGYNSVDAEPPSGYAFEAELEGGIWNGVYREPLVGDDAVYAVGRTAEPYNTEPYRFDLYAYALSREDGSQLWRTKAVEAEGPEGQRAVREWSAGLGRDALYTVHLDAREGSFGTTITKVGRDGRSVDPLVTLDTASAALPPVIDGGTLFTFDAEWRVVAVSTDDGHIRYRSEPYLTTHHTGAPVVGSDAIALVNQGRTDGSEPEWSQLTVLDRADGSHRWTTPLGVARSIPTVTERSVYVVEGDRVTPFRFSGAEDAETIPPRALRAFDLANGAERWSFEYEREATKTRYSAGGATTLSVDPESVYLALGFDDVPPPGTDEATSSEFERNRYRGPNLFALDRGDGSVRWETTLGESAKVFVPTAVDENYLYALRRPPVEEPVLSIVDKTDGTVVDTLTEGFRRDGWLAVSDGECYQTNGWIDAWQ